MATTFIDHETAAPGTEQVVNSQPYGMYACPACKNALEAQAASLDCPACGESYPILDEIPDFMSQDLKTNTSHDVRIMAKRDGSGMLNFLASTYETYIYPPVCNLYGGWGSASLKGLARDVSDIVGQTIGKVLDVACGPGTYGRRMASPARAIYGVDICLSMLRQGARYVERERLANVHFARGMVEKLPFADGVFDAAICAGSLNHFPDTLLALREINRVMKPGAPLAVMCFVISRRGLLQYKFMRDRTERNGGHVFALADLDRFVAEAGFEDFRPRFHGAIIVVGARKRLE